MPEPTWYETWWNTLTSEQRDEMAAWVLDRSQPPPKWVRADQMWTLACRGGQWSPTLRHAILATKQPWAISGLAFFEGPAIDTVATIDIDGLILVMQRFGPILGRIILTSLVRGLMQHAPPENGSWVHVPAIISAIRRSSPSESSWGYVWLMQHGVDIGQAVNQITDPHARLIWALWTDGWDSQTQDILRCDEFTTQYLRERQQSVMLAEAWKQPHPMVVSELS